MADKSWKKLEREVAESLGGRRIPASGAAQFPGECGDVYHEFFEIECKYRTPPIGVVGWFKEVIVRSKKSEKIPLLVVRQKGLKIGPLVIMKLPDFESMIPRHMKDVRFHDGK